MFFESMKNEGPYNALCLGSSILCLGFRGKANRKKKKSIHQDTWGHFEDAVATSFNISFTVHSQSKSKLVQNKAGNKLSMDR